jgi:hydrogenase maturation protease
MTDSRPAVLVLGLGNLLLCDDGLGLELLTGLRRSHGQNSAVEFVDGGTLGLGLLAEIEGRRALLILDAIGGGVPGEARRLVNPHLHPTACGVGVHGANASGLLAAAMLIGDLPEQVLLVGATPACLTTGIGLSEAFDTALPAALQLAQESLEQLLETIAGAATCTS